jgi:hypothetical protein
LDRDPYIAILVRVGCPRILDYKERSQPFWNVKEKLAHYLFIEDRKISYVGMAVSQRIGAQGYPASGFSVDVAKQLMKDAHAAVTSYGRLVLPWATWPTDKEIEQHEKAAMAEEAQELIDAWIQRFEPENAQTRTPGK